MSIPDGQWKLRPATPKQAEFIGVLVDERGGPDAMPVEIQIDLLDLTAGVLNGDEASILINKLQAMPRTVWGNRTPTASAPPDVSLPDNTTSGPVPRTDRVVLTKGDVGVYVIPEYNGQKNVIMRLKESKRNPGRIYTERWVGGSRPRLHEDGVTRLNGDFVFTSGGMNYIRPEYKMNLAQAEAFAIMYGKCVRCGRKLKDAESVQRALGPVCVKYFEMAP